MRSFEAILGTDAQGDDENKEQTDYHIPEEISELFRLYEMDIRCRGNPVYYRVITSNFIDQILKLEKAGLFFTVLHLMQSLDGNDDNADDDVLEAWCILISFFAENFGIESAPQGSDMLSDWFTWAAEFVGIEYSEELEEDEDGEEGEEDAEATG